MSTVQTGPQENGQENGHDPCRRVADAMLHACRKADELARQRGIGRVEYEEVRPTQNFVYIRARFVELLDDDGEEAPFEYYKILAAGFHLCSRDADNPDRRGMLRVEVPESNREDSEQTDVVVESAPRSLLSVLAL